MTNVELCSMREYSDISNCHQTCYNKGDVITVSCEELLCSRKQKQWTMMEENLEASQTSANKFDCYVQTHKTVCDQFNWKICYIIYSSTGSVFIIIYISLLSNQAILSCTHTCWETPPLRHDTVLLPAVTGKKQVNLRVAEKLLSPTFTETGSYILKPKPVRYLQSMVEFNQGSPR